MCSTVVADPKYVPMPIDKSALKKQQSQREFEKKLSKIMWGVAAHGTVLLLANCIGWGIINNSYVFMNLHTKLMLDWDPELYDQDIATKVLGQKHTKQLLSSEKTLLREAIVVNVGAVGPQQRGTKHRY